MVGGGGGGFVLGLVSYFAATICLRGCPGATPGPARARAPRCQGRGGGRDPGVLSPDGVSGAPGRLSEMPPERSPGLGRLHRACHAGPHPRAHPRAGPRARPVRPRPAGSEGGAGRSHGAPQPAPPRPRPPPPPNSAASRPGETLRQEAGALLGRRRTRHKGSENRAMRGVGWGDGGGPRGAEDGGSVSKRELKCFYWSEEIS